MHRLRAAVGSADTAHATHGKHCSAPVLHEANLESIVEPHHSAGDTTPYLTALCGDLVNGLCQTYRALSVCAVGFNLAEAISF